MSFRFNINTDRIKTDNPLKLHVSLPPVASAVGGVAQPIIAAAAAPKLAPHECLMPPDEIQAHSLLRHANVEGVKSEFEQLTQAQDPSSLPAAVLRITGNFAGSGLVTGDKAIDGMQPSPNFALWQWLLKGLDAGESQGLVDNLRVGLHELYSHSTKMDALKKQLAPDAAVYDEALEYTKRIKNLKRGESLPFYGGYANDGAQNSSGHAQIFEIRRREDGQFDVVLYTSTNFELADVYLSGDKARLKPIVLYSRIPEHVLLFNGDGTLRPAFIASLNELKVNASKNLERTTDDEDVLQILDYLAPYFTPSSFQECGLITGQRGGTCVPSVTKVWMRHHLGHQQLYKQIIFHCKLRLLTASFLSLAPTLSKDEKARKLLTELSRSVLRHVDKLLSKNLISLEVATQARATAHDCLNQICTFEAAIEDEKKRTVALSDPLEAVVKDQRRSRSYLYFPQMESAEVSPACATAVVDRSIVVDVANPSAKNLLKAIRKTEEACQKIQQQQQETNSPDLQNTLQLTYQMQIAHLIDQIPLAKIGRVDSSKFRVEQFEAPFWAGFSEGELRSTQEKLYNLLRSPRSKFLPRHFATLLPGFAILHFLSLKIDAKKWKQLPINRDVLLESYPTVPFEQVLTIEGLQFFEKSDFVRLKEAAEYLRNYNALGFRNPVLFKTEKESEVEKKEVKECPANGIYWHALLDNDPELAEKTKEKADAKFPDPTEQKIEADFERQVREKVQNPARLIRLPSNTKATLVLGEFYISSSLLSQCGYNHADILRHFSFICRNALFDQNKGSLIQQSVRHSLYKYAASLEGVDDSDKPTDALLNKVWEMQRPVLDEHLKFREQLVALRSERSWDQPHAEGKALINKQFQDDLLNRLLRTLSQWELTPHQILLELQKEFKQLEDPSLQSLLLHLLFRSPVAKDLELGFGDLICSNQALFENAFTFIQKGLIYSFGSQEPLTSGSFFFTLSFALCKYLHDAGQEERAQKLNLVDELTRWLETKRDFSDQQRSLLHLFRASFYALKPTLNVEECASLYTSWISYKLNPPSDGKWRSPFVEYWVEMALMQVTTALEPRFASADFSQNLGTALFEQLKLDPERGARHWSIDPTLGFPYLTSGEWKINLSAGKVFHTQGELKGVSTGFPWEKTEDFKRLFPEEKGFSYQALGDQCVQFTHPTKGTFRLYRQRSRWWGEEQFTIQKRMSDEFGWCTYCPPDKLEKTFPQPLIDHYALWTLDQGREIKGFLAHLKTQQVTSILTRDGLIRENEYHLDYLQPENVQVEDLVDYPEFPLFGLARFDSLYNIVTYRNSRDQIEKIAFPRYHSLDQNPLTFIQKKGRFVWEENQDYALPKTMKGLPLGTIDNFLLLEPVKEGSSKLLLVPLQQIVVDKPGIAAKGSLKIKGSDETEYVVYKLEGEKILPTSLESKLFLAYLHLSQKKEGEAIQLLRTVKPTESLSERGKKILEMIQDLPLGDDHPNPIQVKLHALLLQMQKMDQEAVEPVKEYFEEEPKRLSQHLKDLHKLFQRLHNISHDCRLTKEEERYLLQKLLHEGRGKLAALSKLDESFPFEIVFSQIEERLKADPEQVKKINVAARTRTRKKGYELEFTTNINLTGYRVTKKPDPDHWRYRDDRALYEKELAEYQGKMESHKSDLEAELYWLNRGIETFDPHAIPKYPYTSMPEDFKNRDRCGKLFLEVLYTALSRNSSAIQEMLFRLKMWREQLDSPIAHLDCMIMILLKPEEFRSVIKSGFWERKKDFESEYQNKYKVLCEIRSRYFSIFYNKEKYNLLANLNPFPSPKEAPISFSGAFPRPKREGAVVRKLTDFGPEKMSLNLSFDPQTERWKQLESWKKKLTIEDVAIEPYQELDFKYRDKLLTPGEKIFEESLKKDLELLQRDYDEGKKLNHAEHKVLLDQTVASTIKAEAEEQLKAIQQERKALEAALLSRANVRSKEELQRTLELARLGGKIDKLMTLEECVACLLSSDGRSFLLKNPNLTSGDVQELARLTLSLVDKRSYEAQLKKIVGCLQDISEADPETRPYLCKKLEGLVEGKYHFDAFNNEEQVALRIFAGQTGNIPYQIQTDLIHKMLQLEENKFKEIVIQLIMGGGKTAIIATILLYLAAKRQGRMAFFIVPPSQFTTFSANFSAAMEAAFGKQILALNMVRDDFTLYKLEQTLQLLTKAQGEDLPVILSAMTLQGLELEELSLARKLRSKILEQNDVERQSAKEPPGPVREAFEQKSKELSDNIIDLGKNSRLIAEILTLSADHADGLLDEVDQILDCYQEVTYVDGEKEGVDPLRNQLLMTLYKGMVASDLRIETLPGTPLLKDVVRVHLNQHSLLNSSEYLQHVVPVLARYLVQQFKPIATRLGTHQDAFIRYVSHQMPSALQQFAKRETAVSKREIAQIGYPHASADISFLQYLHRLHQGNEQQKEAADLISIAKHYLYDLTKITLSKVGARNYGASRNPQLQGKIIPYLGVNAPATTEFGYHWEVGAYHYQYGLGFKPTAGQILDIAQIYLAAAHYYRERNGEKFEETAEYLEFQEIYGVKLDQVHLPSEMERAIANVSSNPFKLLELQYSLVERYATFAKERLTGDGFALLDLLASTRAMSGTPWNVEGYEERLASRFEPSLGTEGRILHKFATREKQNRIFEVDFNKGMKDFLQQIYSQHPQPGKIRKIVDVAGSFKNFGSNADVAKAWIDSIEDPRIEAILFFHTDPGELQPNTLYAYRKGASAPERIGGSSYEALKAKGLTPEKYVCYIDERHKEGTDILMIPDARGLKTVDEKTLLRSDTQGSMRLRQLLHEQHVDYVVCKECRKSIFNQGQTLEDILLNEAKVQSVRKASSLVRYFTKQIHHLFRRQAVQAVRKADRNGQFDASYARLIDCYEQFFTDFFNEEPYLQFGALETTITTKEELKGILQRKLDLFKEKLKTAPQVIATAEKDAAQLGGWIDRCHSLPKEWKQITSGMGVEAQVEQELELEVETQVQTEVEKEIELELARYEQLDASRIAAELPMSFDEFERYVGALGKDPREHAKIYSLKEQLGKYRYGFREKRDEYPKIFNQPIFGTRRFFYTCEYDLLIPVFHPVQRPIKQILVVQAGAQMRFLALSEHEAKDVQKHLETLYRTKPETKVWLIQPDGSQFVKGDELFPKDDASVLEALLEINAFNGNMEYLDHGNNMDETEKWLSTDVDLKVKFLKLKTFRHKKQQMVLQSSPLIAIALGKMSKKIRSHAPQQCKKRAEWELSRKEGAFKPEHKWQAKILNNAKQIRNLNSLFVPLLGIDPKGTDEETRVALAKLTPEEAERITKFQFDNLEPFQGAFLTPDQMRWVPFNKVRYLKNDTQIRRENNGAWEYLLRDDQVKGLVEGQEALIPFVNPAFFKDFDESWQIQNVPVSHLPNINPVMGSLLSEGQIKALTVDQMKKAFPKAFEQFLDQQIEWIPGDLIEHLPKEKRDCIIQEQIEGITDRTLVPKLEELAPKAELWSSWVAPEMVSAMNKEQYQHLKTAAQIAQVPLPSVPRLKPDQVPLISEPQAPFLEGKKQIQSCPDAFVCKLTVAQIPEIALNQVPLVDGEAQVQALPATKEVVEKFEKRHFVHLTADQAKLLSEVQIGLMDCPEEIAKLEGEQVIHIQPAMARHLSDRQLTHLLSEKHIAEIADALIPRLDPVKQVPKITLKQAKLLEGAAQIQACPDPYVEGLTPLQIPFIKESQVPHLKGKAQIQAIMQEGHFVHLIPTQMEDVSEDQLKWVTEAQVEGLSNAQLLKLKNEHPRWKELLEHLTQKQIESFDSKELVALIPASLFKFVTASQVKYLTEEWQIHALASRSLVANLEKGQVRHILPEQAKWLTEKQIGQMDFPDEVAKLANYQCAFLGEKGLEQLSQTVIKQLQSRYEFHWNVPLLHPQQLPALTDPRAISNVTDKQIDAFGSTGFNQLPKSHPLWERITPKAVENLNASKVSLIAKNMLRYLKSSDALRSLSMIHFVHLTKEQLKQRKSWRLTYILGVLTLGVAACCVSLVAYLLFPVIALLSWQKGKRFHAMLYPNVKRMGHLFTTYLPAAVAA